MLGFFLNADDAVTTNFSDTETFRILNFLQQDFRPAALLPEVLDGMADIIFDNIVPEYDANGFAIGKMFGET